MAEAIEDSLIGTTCSANSDCDAVTCQDGADEIKVEIDMCEDPPEVELSANGTSDSVKFDESTNTTFRGANITAILDWDSESEILALEVKIYVPTTPK